MNNIKKTVIGITIAVAMGVTLSQPVWANANEAEAALEATDLSYAFGQAVEPAQMTALSEQEMKETEGAVAPWVIATGVRMGWGALAGGVRYGVTNWGTSQWTLRNQIRSIGYGAVSGLIGRTPAWSATIGTATSAGGMRWGW